MIIYFFSIILFIIFFFIRRIHDPTIVHGRTLILCVTLIISSGGAAPHPRGPDHPVRPILDRPILGHSIRGRPQRGRKDPEILGWRSNGGEEHGIVFEEGRVAN